MHRTSQLDIHKLFESDIAITIPLTESMSSQHNSYYNKQIYNAYNLPHRLVISFIHLPLSTAQLDERQFPFLKEKSYTVQHASVLLFNIFFHSKFLFLKLKSLESKTRSEYVVVVTRCHNHV